jgi:acyl-CoA oxidase
VNAEDNRLTQIFADPLFDPAEEAADTDGALPYRRLRYVREHVSAGRPLLHHDPEYLRALLETAAIVDPRLFHIMFLDQCMATGGILEYAADPTVLDEVSGGFSVGTALMTELGHGNSGANILTEAVYDPEQDEFVLNSPVPEAVKFPPNVGLSGWAKWGVVGARLKQAGADRGLFLFLVPLRDEAGPRPGVRIRTLPATSLLPLDYASVAFDAVRVPRRHWLSDGARLDVDGAFADPVGGPAERSRRSAALVRFAWGALCPGLAAMARAGTAIALNHAGRRVISNRFALNVPALEYRNQQRLLVTSLASAFAATALADGVPEVCWRLTSESGSVVEGGAAQGASAVTAGEMRTASLIKVAVDRLAERAITAARATCGALGFMAVNRLVDYLAFTMAFASAGGDNEVILLEAAWSMVAGQDYVPPLVEPADVPLEARCLDLLRVREARLHALLTTRLQAAVEKVAFETEDGDTGDGMFSAWNDQADLARTFAEAHIDRLVGEAMLASGGSRLPEPLRAELALYLNLESVERHDGWYQAQGLLTAEESRALADLLTDNDRRGRISELFDAFLVALDVPLALTRAAIAEVDYVRALAPR